MTRIFWAPESILAHMNIMKLGPLLDFALSKLMRNINVVCGIDGLTNVEMVC